MLPLYVLVLLLRVNGTELIIEPLGFVQGYQKCLVVADTLDKKLLGRVVCVEERDI